MQIVVNHFELGKKSVILNVHPVESIYAVKARMVDNPDAYSIHFHGKPLTDSDAVCLTGLMENSSITIQRNGMGGISRYTVLLYILYALALSVFILSLISGFYTVIAYLYSFMLKDAFGTMMKYGQQFLQSFLDFLYEKTGWDIRALTGCIFTPAKIFVIVLDFIVKHTMIFLLIYILGTMFSYPLLVWKTHNSCSAIYIAKNIGITLAIIFNVIYGIYNIPNTIINILITVMGISRVLSIVGDPILKVTEEGIDETKYGLVYSIPIIGSPLIINYHLVVATLITLIASALGTTEVYNCNDPKNMQRVANLIANNRWKEYPALASFIKNYRLQTLVYYLSIAFDCGGYDKNGKCISGRYAQVTKQFDQQSALRKMDILGIFSQASANYYGATLARDTYCGVVDMLLDVDSFFNYMGGSDSITDMIKSGSIAGIGTTIAYLIILILMFFLSSMYGQSLS